jgi:hypothetical protein
MPRESLRSAELLLRRGLVLFRSARVIPHCVRSISRYTSGEATRRHTN